MMRGALHRLKTLPFRRSTRFSHFRSNPQIFDTGFSRLFPSYFSPSHHSPRSFPGHPDRAPRSARFTTSFPGSLLFTPQEAREGRPWLGLVTCLPEKNLTQGGVLRLLVFVKIYCPNRLPLCCAQPMRNSYDIAFTNPEAFISCKEGMDLFEIKPYQSAVRVVVVDKAHCISEW